MTDDLAALHPPDLEPLDEVTVRALDLVVDAHGDLDLWYAIGTGALEGRRSAVVRFARRAGIEVPDLADGAPGDLVAIPAGPAVALCRAFCRRHRLTVERHLLAEERRIEAGAPPPGGDRTARRARALVRTWTDGDERGAR